MKKLNNLIVHCASSIVHQSKTLTLLLVMLMSVNMAWGADPTVVLDFEGSGTFPYNADWTCDGTAVSTQNHTTGGSHCVSYNVNGPKYITYAKSLNKVKSVSFWGNRTTNNTNHPTITVEMSPDKKNWSEYGSATPNLAKNSWTQGTITLTTPTSGYIRLKYTCGTTAVKYIDDITITYTDSYTITPQSNNDLWGTVELEGSTITATPKSGYRVSTTTPYEVTSGTAEVEQNGNTFTVTPSEDCTVQINFEAIPSHDIFWYANGQQFAQYNQQEGIALTIPSDPAPATYCDGKAFVGWTATQNYSHASAAPGDLFTSKDSKTVGSTTAYYAVFADADGDPVKGWQLSTTAPVDGDNVLFVGKTSDGAYKMMKVSGTTITVGNMALNADGTVNTTSTPVTDYTWTTGEATYSSYTGLGFKIGSGNILHINSSAIKTASDYQNGTFEFTANGDGFEMKGNQNNRWLKFNGSTFTYSTTAVAIYVFKNYEKASYSNYTTTCETQYNIEYLPTTGGTISGPAKSAADKTITLSYEVTPGYQFDSWTVLDGDAEYVPVTNNQFKMPTSNVEVEGSFSCATPTFKTDLSTVPVEVTQGLTAPTLTVAANETYTINYQWQSRTDQADWSNIGTNSASYATSSATVGTTYFRCLLKNGVSSCETFATSNVAAVTVNAPSKCETPTFSLAEGTYTGAQSVTLSCLTPEAKIYYTTDGTEPSTSSTEYTGAINVFKTMTIRAIAAKDNVQKSDENSILYTIQYTVTFAMQDHGEQVQDQKVSYEGSVEPPTTTSITGWTFGGWFKEGACTTPWDFATDKVTTNPTILYALWTEKKFDVILLNSGNQVGETLHIQEGATLGTNLPTLTEANACDPHSRTFAGWTTEAWTEPKTTFTAFVTPSTTVNDNMTLNAVWAEETVVPSTTYSKITSESKLTEGNYVIAYKYDTQSQFVLKNEKNGSSTKQLAGYVWAPTSDQYSNPDEAYIWKITSQGDGSYSIYNAAVEQYVNATSAASGDGTVVLSTTPSYFNFTYNSTDSRWIVGLKDGGNYCFHGYSSDPSYYFKVSTSPKTSGSANKYRTHLYKQGTTIGCKNYITTCSTDPLIEVSPAELKGFSTIATTNEPSDAKTFTVEGYNLTNNITVTAPDGYEVSQDNSTYSASVPLNLDGDKVKETILYVRLAAADAAKDEVKGNITVASEGADTQTKTIALTGTIVAKTLQSIAVTTEPKKKYILGETFNPEGLVIKATYNSGDETVEYAGNKDKFTFSPDLETALKADDAQETIIFGGQTTTVDLSYQCSVAWQVNGSDWTKGVTTVVDYNASVAAPTTAPTKTDCDDEKVFVGWTADEEITGAPADLFTETSSKLTANTTFYAVFANASEGGTTTVTKDIIKEAGIYETVILNANNNPYQMGELPITLTGAKGDNNFPALNYNTSGTDLRFYKGLTCAVTIATTNSQPITKIEFKKNETTASSLSNLTANGGTLTDNVWTGSAESVTFTYNNSSSNFKEQIYIINVTYSETGGTQYSDYTITCCQPMAPPTNIVVDGEIGTDKVTIKWDPVDGAKGYQYSTDKVSWLEHKTTTSSKVLSGLTPNTEYTYYFRATDNTGAYCEFGKIGSVTFTTAQLTVDITFDAATNGGAIDGQGTKVMQYEYNGAELTLPTPDERTGYKFNGWFTSKTGTEQITNVGGDNKPQKDVTYYAQWKQLKQYTITYNVPECLSDEAKANYAEGTTQYEGMSVDFKELPADIEDWTCIGWSTSNPTTAVKETPEILPMQIQTGLTGNMTVYAIYKKGEELPTGEFRLSATWDGMTNYIAGWNDKKYSNTTTTEANGKIFGVEDNQYVYFWDGETKKYLVNGDGTDLTVETNKNNLTSTAEWTVETDEDGYLLIHHTLKSERYIAGKTVSSAKRFAAYATGEGVYHQLIKHDIIEGQYLYTTAPCMPECVLSVSGNVHLTSGKDITVYTTTPAGNVITVSAPHIDRAAYIQCTFLDKTGNADNAPFALCENTDTYAKVTDGRITTTDLIGEFNRTYAISYKPSVANQIDNYTLQLTAYDDKKVELSTCTLAISGRSLPEQFVIAVNDGKQWLAVPNTLSTSAEAAPKALPIEVYQDENGDYAVNLLDKNAPNCLYSAAAHPTGTGITWRRGGIRFQSAKTEKYITASYSDVTSFYMPNNNAETQQFYLSSTDLQKYMVTLDPGQYENNAPTRWISLYSGQLGWHKVKTDAAKEVYFLPIGDYVRDLSNDQIGTLCLPFNVKAGNFTGADFYEMSYKELDAEGKPFRLYYEQQVDQLTAGKAYIFVPNANRIVCKKEANAPIDFNSLASYNGFVGTFDTIQPAVDNILVDKYMVYNNMFQLCGKNCGLLPYRAYIDMDNVPLQNELPQAPTRRLLVMGKDKQPVYQEPGEVNPGIQTGWDDVLKANNIQKLIINDKMYILRAGKMYDATGKFVK